MKRSPLNVGGAVNSEILRNYTPKQLELIGSIAIVYNGCEHILHNLAGYCIGYPKSTRIITSRINGTDGLVAIVIEACEAFKSIDDETLKLIKRTLQQDGFSHLKTYRDAVIHSMPYLMAKGTAIGRYQGKRGTTQHVLLTEPALVWLKDALLLINDEMSRLGAVILAAVELSRPSPSPEHKRQAEEALQHAMILYPAAQLTRLDNSKPPEFPTEEEVRAMPLRATISPRR